MERVLVPLHEVGGDAGARAWAGGKAVGLATLASAGLPVPAAFVVPAPLLDRWWRQVVGRAEADAADPVQAEALAARLRATAWPEGWAEAWIAGARALGGPVAVRSSGADEDSGTHSFAGQHDTFLDLRPEQVPDAVRSCLASLFGARAAAYRAHAGRRPAGLAVVVQRMVRPVVSGVLFTIHPTTGSWREMVVEAVFGLGEGLVSGQIAPQSFVVRRPRDGLPRGLRRLAERVRLQVVSEDVHGLGEELIAGPGGPERVQITDARRTARTLEPSELRKLCRLGLAAERAVGGPCDVEWVKDDLGRFHLVQARPVTTVGPTRAQPASRGGPVLFTRRFVGERWSEPATPLGWSLLEPILTSFVSYPETERRFLGGGAPFRLFGGWPYVNTTIFRHLAFKLPGSPAPAFMLELLPPEEEQALRRAFAVPPDLEVYRSIFETTFRERRWQRFRWNPFTNHLYWDRFVDELERFLATREPSDTPERHLAAVDEHLARIRAYIGIHLCSLLFANLAWQLLDGALARTLPEGSTRLRDALAVCPPGNLTVETNRALHALARSATAEDLDALRRGEVRADAFGTALRAFLDRFGHRSTASWELMAPRWRDHPELLVPLLLAQRQNLEDPAEREARQEVRFAEAQRTVREALSGPNLSLVELLVQATRRYLLLRENQRFWFDRLLLATQDELLALGDGLVASGALPTRDDVAFLTWDELRTAVRSAPAPELAPGLHDRVRARRAAWEQHRGEPPPVFLRGESPVLPAPTGPRLAGLGISPGLRKGPVRVLRTLDDGARLVPGEVLVARAVDPAWTPLFLTAAAVVLELGSVLSHGAVVAREYGVPAVVNVDSATSRLRDGQVVTVDGTRGLVFVHDGAPAAP